MYIDNGSSNNPSSYLIRA